MGAQTLQPVCFWLLSMRLVGRGFSRDIALPEKWALAPEAAFLLCGRIMNGPFSVARVPDRRERAEFFPRGREALSHAARGEHRHPEARGIGGPATARARRAPSEADRRR